MNRIFSTVWNAARQCLVVVNEAAGSAQAHGASSASSASCASMSAGFSRGAAAAAVSAALGFAFSASALAAEPWPTAPAEGAIVFGTADDWDASNVSVFSRAEVESWMARQPGEALEDWKARVNALVLRVEEPQAHAFGSLGAGSASKGVYVLGGHSVQLFDAGNAVAIDAPVYVFSLTGKPALRVGDASSEARTEASIKSVAVGDGLCADTVLSLSDDARRDMQAGNVGYGSLSVENAALSTDSLYLAGFSQTRIAKDAELNAGSLALALQQGGYIRNEGTVAVTGDILTPGKLEYAGQIDNAGALTVAGSADLYAGLHTASGAKSEFKRDLTLGGGRLNGLAVATTEIPADGPIEYVGQSDGTFEASREEGYFLQSTTRSLNEGNLLVSGDLTVRGYWILGNSSVHRGVLENTKTGFIGAANLAVNGLLENAGSIALRGTAGGSEGGSLSVATYGALVNLEGGTITAGASSSSTIGGLFRNAGTVSFHDVDFNAPAADFADNMVYSAKPFNAGTISATGTARVHAALENAGLFQGEGEGAVLEVSANGAFINAGTVSCFQTVQIRSGGHFSQTVGNGAFSAANLTIDAGGEFSVEEKNGALASIALAGALENSGTLLLDGMLSAESASNSGTIRAGALEENDSPLRSGSISLEGLFVNTGSVYAAAVTPGSLTNADGAHLEADVLILKGRDASESNLGGTVIADEAQIERAASANITGSASFGELTNFGSLSLKDGSSLVVQNLSGDKSGILHLEGGSTLALANSVDANGLTFSLEGGSIELAEGAEIRNAGYEIANGTSAKLGEGVFKNGIGEGNTLVLDGGDFSFGSTALDGENAIEIKNGTLTANTISFSGDKKITLNGGTFETAFNQMFEGFETGTVTGKDENGNNVVVQVPSAGITSVGTVKEAVKKGLEVVSGTFRFTGAENGWTAGTVASAQSVLTSTFTPTGSINVAFAGEGAGADGVKYDTAFFNGIAKEETVNRIIFEDIALEAGKPSLIVGEGTEDDSTAVVKDGFGYGYIKNAVDVTVTEGKTLQLAGFVGENAWQQHLLSASLGDDDSMTLHSGAELILGSGEKRGGLISNLTMNDAKLSVLENGEFHAANVKADGTNVLGSSSSGTLQIGTLTTYSSTDKTTFNGRVSVGSVEDADGAGNVNGEVLNNGSLTYGGEAIAFLGGFSNAGSFGMTNEAGAQVTVQGGENTGSIEVLHDGDGRFTAAEKTFTNKGALSADRVYVTSEFINEKTVTAAYAGIEAGVLLTNSGTMTLSAEESAEESGSNQALEITGGKLANSGTVELKKSGFTLEAEGSEIANSGTITALAADIRNGTLAMTGSGKLTVGAFSVGNNAAAYALDPRAGETVTGKYIADGDAVLNAESFTVANQGSASFSGNAKLQGAKTTRVAEGGTLSADGSAVLSVGEMGVSGSVELKGNAGMEGTKLTVASTGAMALAGTSSIGFDSIRIEKEGSLAAEDGASVTTKTLQTFNETFKLNGALTITGDKGIQFMKTVDGKEVEDASSKVLAVETGREYAQTSGDFSTTLRRFDVTKGSTVAFGADAAGLAAKMAEKSETAKGWMEKAAQANSGILSVGTNIRLAAGSGVSLGGPSAGADAAKPYVNAAADSVTVISGKVFENDGAAFEAVGTQGTATIDKDAKLVLTSLSKEGEITFFKNFDLSGNVSGSAWVGGWTGEGAIYVADGSELWNVETYWDAEAGTFKGKAELADVRTKYDLVIADIANAALRSDAGNGGDVKFLQAAIRNTTLSFDETNRLVNSVAQIGASVGAQASFVSDVSSFADTVEERAGYRSASEEGFWLKAEGGKKTQDKLDLAGGMKAGYETDAYGFTFGGDVRVVPEIRVGAAFSYMKGKADSKGDVLTAENDYDTFGVQGYGSWDVSDSVRVIGDVGYFHTSNDIEQTIAHADVRSAEAKVKSNAITFGARVEGMFDFDAVTVIPHAGIRGIFAVNDDYTTRIDGENAFRNEAENTFTAQLPVGVALEKTFATASGWEVAPYADITLIPQFGDTDSTTTVKGVGTGVSNKVSSDFAGTFAGQLALGVSAGKDAFSFGASYGLTAGNAGREDHVFSIAARYAF